MKKTDPEFNELRRSLTGSRHGEEPWSLEKQLKGAIQIRKEEGNKMKKLDVG